MEDGRWEMGEEEDALCRRRRRHSRRSRRSCRRRVKLSNSRSRSRSQQHQQQQQQQQQLPVVGWVTTTPCTQVHWFHLNERIVVFTLTGPPFAEETYFVNGLLAENRRSREKVAAAVTAAAAAAVKQ
ncbi:hypothetical protein M0802_012865 [Mischocyttarus mexicanus]|nr:hypothetical protein M0802_012865 [Mischocyttarus mexicanus]